MKLKFNDGIEFDLSGPLRIEGRYDGLYVVGGGFLMAVASEEEGLVAIEERKKRKPEAESEFNKMWTDWKVSRDE